MFNIDGDHTLNLLTSLNLQVPIAVEGEIFTLSVKGDLQSLDRETFDRRRHCAEWGPK